METSDSIHDFWFGSQSNDAAIAKQQSSLWWCKNPDKDLETRSLFQAHVEAAAQHRYDDWAETAPKLIALIILTDQFPRSIYRNTPKAFELDSLAQALCLSGLAREMDRLLRPIERLFFYLPLEHAESEAHQELSVQLYTRLFQEVPLDQVELFRGYLTFALRHRRIIARFGRFPHRNAILGRPSTADELAFLEEAGSSF